MGKMPFAYYNSFSLIIGVDFVNTYAEPSGQDALTTEADLERFLRRYADLSFLDGADVPKEVDLDEVARLYADALARWSPTAADVRALRALRAKLRTVFAVAGEDPGRAIDTLNTQVAKYRALPRISVEHGGPHLHFEAVRDGCAHWLAVSVLMSLVMFVCDGNSARLGICASASCRRAFVDRSKNGRKTYCSDACAHRESVAAFRARRRRDGEGAAERTAGGPTT
jgi:predicted RNA-binding Zn ribbon-like protein